MKSQILEGTDLRWEWKGLKGICDADLLIECGECLGTVARGDGGTDMIAF